MADAFARLGALIANLESLASGGSARVSEAAAKAVERVLEKQYTEGKGPDGQGWKAKADGQPSLLQESGRMRAGTQAVAGVKGITVRIPKPGGFHQGGTVKMPARPLVPSGDALPPAWEKPIADAIREAITSGVSK